MITKNVFSCGVLLIGIITACNNYPQTGDTDATDVNEDESVTMEPENDAPESYEKDGLKIYPAPQSVQFENASLSLKSPAKNAEIAGNEVNFDFDVEGYELGVKTSDADDKGIANSDKGQHIHLILDNDPYSAHYQPEFTKEVEDGHHIAIAFLSRSYHESVKNLDAYKVFQFIAGEVSPEDKMVDLNRPMLFYSRPKGEYKGADTKKVLFDFYLVNAKLKADGYSVLVTVNDKHQLEIDEWQPYYIEGLPMGENTISIELVNAQGNRVDSPVSGTTRTFTLVE